ncbi:hypothetical protein PCANC_20065 [Puccinia coronata f. sp. avenae]|uniref:Uncharacterized protein n=1 Tax=Puccinia coronata f. sp. avenae TaxID=200324 RepID=A0A2N5T182_9BASI|nr:hypothetical protein PCANC_20065 [Puccinia coronata f. sp. avenae]
MCMPTIGVHTVCSRARQAVCKACTPFGQACRLCKPVGSRNPLDLRGLREPRYPYKGTRTLIRVRYRSTLIRVPKYPYKGTCTLIRVPKYPYKGYQNTLIRVLCTRIAGLTSAS